MVDQRLDELLQRCTAKLSVSGKMGHGTGFFVAPGLILTCAHVVEAAGFEPVKVCWQNQDGFADAVTERFLPKPFDLALLRLSSTVNDLPCVYLDKAIQPDDNLYTYGYPDDFPRGAPVTGQCEGLTGDEPPLIKFKAGQIRPGLSGSPLLNLRTGKVCGIVKFTRDRSIDLGGGAIPTTVILSQWPELEKQNHEFHQRDTRWTKLLARPSPTTHLTRQEYQNCRELLKEVKSEVVGRLRDSLHNAVLINLQKESQPQQVCRSWDVEVKTSHQTSYQLSPGTDIIEVFDQEEIAGKLLILGAPGAGKTITQLELAQALITRAEEDGSEPVPVLLNLSFWKDDNQTIADWLVAEVKSKYYHFVGIDIVKKFVKNRQLLPLLDGLDELKSERQERCVVAINELLKSEQQPQYLVVCSRLEEYKSYDTELQLNGAICLQPLTEAQIQQYLANVERPELWQGIQDDSSLLELARSPLLLDIITLAYKEISVQEWQRLNTTPERLKYLFNSYIQRMLDQPIKNQWYAKSKEPKPEQTQRWLAWLARRLKEESQNEFLIERMQPNWLKHSQRQTYSRGVMIIVVLIVELIFGLSYGLIELILGRSDGTGLLMVLLFSGLLLGLFLGKSDGSTKEIKPVESLKWSWRNLGLQMPPCWVVAWIFAFVVPFFLNLNMLIVSWLAMAPGLITWLVIWLIHGGLRSSDIEIQRKIIPNQGMCNSAANAVILVLLLGLCAALFGSLWDGISFTADGWRWQYAQSIRGLLIGLIVGLGFGLICVLDDDRRGSELIKIRSTAGRACIQHFTLRVILWHNNYIPWNYARFLNYATKRMFLQRVGGRYRFIHALLREHFAEMDTGQIKAIYTLKK